MSLAGRPWRPGLALAAGVLAAHLLVLQGLPVRPASVAPAEAGRSGPELALRVLRDPGLADRVDPAGRAGRVAAPMADPGGASAGSAARPGPEAAAAGAPAASGGSGGMPTPPARVAAPVRLHYRVTTGTGADPAPAGHSRLTWWHDGDRYEAAFEQDTPAGGRRSQRSAGRITPAGLVPGRHAERARAEEAVHFLHAEGRIVFSANRPPADLLPGVQDRLGVLLQLGALLAARPQAYPPGAVIAIQTATTREAAVWRFRVDGPEELRLPGGHQDGVRLVREPTREFEPRIELWLAPALDYAPVRLRLTQPPGGWTDHQWAGSDRP